MTKIFVYEIEEGFELSKIFRWVLFSNTEIFQDENINDFVFRIAQKHQ